jgi:hypothetical protein
VLDLLHETPAGRIVNVTAGIPVRRAPFLENLQGERRYTQFRLSKMLRVPG